MSRLHRHRRLPPPVERPGCAPAVRGTAGLALERCARRTAAEVAGARRLERPGFPSAATAIANRRSERPAFQTAGAAPHAATAGAAPHAATAGVAAAAAEHVSLAWDPNR